MMQKEEAAKILRAAPDHDATTVMNALHAFTGANVNRLVAIRFQWAAFGGKTLLLGDLALAIRYNKAEPRKPEEAMWVSKQGCLYFGSVVGNALFWNQETREWEKVEEDELGGEVK